MVNATALHTAARRFCIGQHAEWVQKYSQVRPTAENYLSPGWTYSDDQCRIFPRYRLAEATLINLERNVPDARSGLDDMMNTVLEACESAFFLAYNRAFDSEEQRNCAARTRRSAGELLGIRFPDRSPRSH